MTPLFDDLKTLEFQSPTFGKISFERVFSKLIEYIEEDPTQKYNLIIGSDSFRSSQTIFVSAIVIHRVGHGGRYFYKKRRERPERIGASGRVCKTGERQRSSCPSRPGNRRLHDAVGWWPEYERGWRERSQPDRGERRGLRRILERPLGRPGSATTS